MAKIRKNFTEEEIRCPCCNAMPEGEVFERFMDLLQVLRDIMGIPFIVTSGFRCRIHNDSLPNSAKDSRHLYGDAVDISRGGWTGQVLRKFVFEAFKLGFSVGLYPTYVHIDQRPVGKTLFP